MDPFSVTVGAVGLLDVANKVTSALIDRYQAFSSAPRQMLEIADQITLCAGLVDVFAKSVDGTGKQDFPRKFQDDASGLITQVSGRKSPRYKKTVSKVIRTCYLLDV